MKVAHIFWCNAFLSASTVDAIWNLMVVCQFDVCRAAAMLSLWEIYGGGEEAGEWLQPDIFFFSGMHH